jgi:DNA-binding CsgD family transcriptional regulator
MDLIAIARDDARWKAIYEFIAACGKAQSPRSLVVEMFNHLTALCPYDQAMAYFFDGNGKVCGQHLISISESWSSAYLGYYFDAGSQNYSCYADPKTDDRFALVPAVIDWDKAPPDEFILNYIRPRGLRYSCGFALFDLNGRYRTMIALDRVSKKAFSDDELTNLRLIIPLLNDLHKNFYYQGFSASAIKRATLETARLTDREIEIVDLLCRGLSPASIGHVLGITSSTTYRHIANIYKKLNVSSQRDLLARLYHQEH